MKMNQLNQIRKHLFIGFGKGLQSLPDDYVNIFFNSACWKGDMETSMDDSLFLFAFAEEQRAVIAQENIRFCQDIVEKFGSLMILELAQEYKKKHSERIITASEILKKVLEWYPSLASSPLPPENKAAMDGREGSRIDAALANAKQNMDIADSTLFDRIANLVIENLPEESDAELAKRIEIIHDHFQTIKALLLKQFPVVIQPESRASRELFGPMVNNNDNCSAIPLSLEITRTENWAMALCIILKNIE